MVQAWLQAGPLRPATQVHLPVDAGCESCDPMMAPQGPAWDAERHLQVPSSAVHAYSIIICTCMAATLMATLAQAHTGPEAHPSVPQYAPACLPACLPYRARGSMHLQDCRAALHVCLSFSSTHSSIPLPSLAHLWWHRSSLVASRPAMMMVSCGELTTACTTWLAIGYYGHDYGCSCTVLL